MSKSSCCSTSLLTFGVVSVPDFGHLYRCVVVSGLIHISLMAYDVKYLFMCLFAICISSLVRCLFRSLVHFKIRLSVFLLLNLKCSVYILDDCPLSNMSFANISLSGLSSPSLDTVFHRAEIFNFNEVQLTNYFFRGSYLLCRI